MISIDFLPFNGHHQKSGLYLLLQLPTVSLYRRVERGQRGGTMAVDAQPLEVKAGK